MKSTKILEDTQKGDDHEVIAFLYVKPYSLSNSNIVNHKLA
ncbi:hypothetical protein BAT_0215 [Bacillus pumilus ATCC 7061]|nr:hypothetical protein BAT_0215 [Bacillus pumilus ATCC 7061]